MKPIVFKTKNSVRIWVPTFTGGSPTIWVNAIKVGRGTIATFTQTASDLEIHETRNLIHGMEIAITRGNAGGGSGGKIKTDFNDGVQWFYANDDYKVGLREHRIITPALENVQGALYRRVLKAIGAAVKYSQGVQE